MSSRMIMTAPLEIGIAVRDLDAMVAFYRDVVGLAEVGGVDLGPDRARRAGFNDTGFDMVRMQTPSGERIKLLRPKGAAPPSEKTDDILGRAGIAYLTFITEGLQARLDSLADAGVELISGTEPIETRPGTKIAFARDIEGNVLEFVEYADIAAYRPDLAAG
jgi:lactoylglutathione lyase